MMAAPTTSTKHPERTCVACKRPGAREDLVRVVASPDGRVALDAKAVKSGRGAWVHPTRGCVATMVKRHAVERSLKIPVDAALDANALLAELRAAMVQRITSLLLVASRTHGLAIGAEAVSAAAGRGRAALVVVAKDAGANAQALAEESTAIRYATREALGALVQRAEVSLLGVRDARIAAELASAITRFGTLED